MSTITRRSSPPVDCPGKYRDRSDRPRGNHYISRFDSLLAWTAMSDMDLPSSARLWSKTDAQAATAPANRRVRWFALRWLGVAVGTGLAGFLLWRIGPDRIGSVVGGANVPLLAGAIGLNVPVIAFRAWRTRALLGRLHAAVPLLDVAEAQLVGQTLSGLTPAASGDLSRAYLWNRRSGVPVATGALVVVAERVLSLLLLVAVGLAALGMAFGGWQARALAALAL